MTTDKGSMHISRAEEELSRLDREQAARYAEIPFQQRLPVWGRNGVSQTRDATDEEIAELRKLHASR